MTALVHNPARDCVNSLGIPVDNLDRSETIERIIAMARTHDGRPRLVSTLNVDFLVNSLGTSAARDRHPELLEVLRNSDLVTADGFPIIWLSRIAGKPLTQRVCGSDLLPELAPRARDEGLSMFLLGGAEGVAQAAAEKLTGDNPGLRIAGTAAPFIQVQGPSLANCIAQDDAMVDRINASGADILLLGLGNPKQELWFNRNRHRLTVPVSIGVGGTFEFITGTVRRAPDWIQTLNLEWIYRITQDPGRLISRYTRGLFKLGWLSLPLISSRISETLLFSLGGEQLDTPLTFNTLWCSRDQSLDVLRLPPLVTASQLETLVDWLVLNRTPSAMRLLDFSRVRRIQMRGYQALFTLAELQRQTGTRLQVLGLTPQLKRQLGTARVLDLLSDSSDTTLGTLTDGQSRSGDPGCTSFALPHATLVFLSGRLNQQSLEQLGLLECLGAGTGQRYILDLRSVSLIETSAIVALQPYFSGGDDVVLSGAGANARQMFNMAEAGDRPTVIDDADLLERIWQGVMSND